MHMPVISMIALDNFDFKIRDGDRLIISRIEMDGVTEFCLSKV